MGINKTRLMAAVIIGLIPPSKFKNWLYKIILNYDIDSSSKIGYSIILSNEVYLISATIGSFNLIYNVKNIKMNTNAIIGNRNIVKHLTGMELMSGSRIGNANNFVKDPSVGENGRLKIGCNSLITAKHMMDFTDDIIIGNDTVIGGTGSQFWTHGFDIYRHGISGPIYIGNNCYIAASCLISLGVSVADRNQIGLGTVLYKSINSTDGLWVSNLLVRKKECEDISKSDEYIVDKSQIENDFYQKRSSY